MCGGGDTPRTLIIGRRDPVRASGRRGPGQGRGAAAVHEVGACPTAASRPRSSRRCCARCSRRTSPRPARRGRRPCRDLWDGATHREEWYAALAVARHRRARPWLDPESLPLWRHLVVTGAWWDVVDETATHLVRDTLAGHPTAVTPVVDAWSVDDDLWLRRTSVICQVGRGEATDRDLLVQRGRGQPRRRHVLAAQGDRVGAPRLRADRSRLGVGVRRRQGERLSPLSRREATKHRAPH